MSFHAGQTFTFGEQPSATKWQYLWDNDYALADGSGISDDAIITRHIADDAVKAANIDFSTFVNSATGIKTTTTVTAGNFSGTSTRSSQGLTMPAGASKALVLATVRLQSQVSAANDMTCRVNNATTGSSAQTGVVTGVGTFAGGMGNSFGIVDITPGVSNTFDLICTAGSNASVSNYILIVIPIPD